MAQIELDMNQISTHVIVTSNCIQNSLKLRQINRGLEIMTGLRPSQDISAEMCSNQ